MIRATTEELKQLSVLYAEDDDRIRKEVAHFLGSRVGCLMQAANGEEAFRTFEERQPDIVISDIMMPLLDGIQLATAVKDKSPTTPVIFTTAFNDTRYLHQAINLGIDGYVLKPIDLHKLIDSIAKSTAALFKARALAASNTQLEAYHRAAEDERHLVAELMARMMRPENLRDSQIRYYLKPTDVVSGDLIAVSRAPNGRLFLMLADSTGHGLPAALNLLPVNHIFYSMIAKELPLALIVEEMNWAIREQSPADRYVAALIACIDTRNRLIEIWNGGIPPALFVGADGKVIRRFVSDNLPLGVLDRHFTAQTEIYQWSEPGQLLIHSDGFSEAEDLDGKAFGEERIVQIVENTPPAQRFDALIGALDSHLGQAHAFDDTTFLLVECASSAPSQG